VKQKDALLNRTREEESPPWALVVHGGAEPAVLEYSEEEHRRRHEALAAALRGGENVLASGGRSLEAVQAAVRVLEDAPDFNAGRGAALTHEGHAELDASIMEGRDRRVGAVAGLRRVKNPIDLARCVLERSGHVFLMGEGAEQFAASQGIVSVDPEYFLTERQIQELRKAIDKESLSRAAGAAHMSGTVGAVALDSHGDLAAATSTGGLMNKRYGRVGDAPIIGSGTYAENGVCAVSATGWGEYFIRNAVAHDLCARIKYAGESVQSAADHVIEAVNRMGGCGGVIAVDAKGRIAMPYSTSSMAHGYVLAGKQAVIVLEDRLTAPMLGSQK
jgi:L-asparaginase / beta-aspartyl-peptidase